MVKMAWRGDVKPMIEERVDSDRLNRTSVTTNPVVGVVDVDSRDGRSSVPCKSDRNHVEIRLGFSALNPGPISPVDPKGQ